MTQKDLELLLESARARAEIASRSADEAERLCRVLREQLEAEQASVGRLLKENSALREQLAALKASRAAIIGNAQRQRADLYDAQDALPRSEYE